MSSSPDEIERLRRAFDALPKVPGHGETLDERHSDVLPEWVMLIVANPYSESEEFSKGTMHTILIGRVPESRQWIKVVFEGTPEAGRFLTAYRDRRLDTEFGGSPWPTL